MFLSIRSVENPKSGYFSHLDFGLFLRLNDDVYFVYARHHDATSERD